MLKDRIKGNTDIINDELRLIIKKGIAGKILWKRNIFYFIVIVLVGVA